MGARKSSLILRVSAFCVFLFFTFLRSCVPRFASLVRSAFCVLVGTPRLCVLFFTFLFFTSFVLRPCGSREQRAVAVDERQRIPSSTESSHSLSPSSPAK